MASHTHCLGWGQIADCYEKEATLLVEAFHAMSREAKTTLLGVASTLAAKYSLLPMRPVLRLVGNEETSVGGGQPRVDPCTGCLIPFRSQAEACGPACEQQCNWLVDDALSTQLRYQVEKNGRVRIIGLSAPLA